MLFDKNDLCFKKDGKLEQEAAGCLQGPDDQAGCLTDNELHFLAGGAVPPSGNQSEVGVPNKQQ